MDVIHWSSGGHSDSDDLSIVRFKSDTVRFSDPKGEQYKVKITGDDEHCFPNGSKLVRCSGLEENGKEYKTRQVNLLAYVGDMIRLLFIYLEKRDEPQLLTPVV